LLCGISATAADLTGKWSGSFKAEGADHSIPQLIILKQQGSALSGSAGPVSNEQYPLENGRVDGNRARFQVTTGEWRFLYDLTLREDSLSGELTLESTTERRIAKVTLTRTKEN
jgi:hypothetical protein